MGGSIESMCGRLALTNPHPMIKNPTTMWSGFLAEDEGFELIKVALRQAVARGAHPRRI